jgi:uncharacterized membrane protein (UPF0127 family)
MSQDIIFIKDKTLDTLVAVSETEQNVGLMWREWPPPVMVFPYKKNGIRKFWMKNTISPLDIIFCNCGKVVGMFHGEPLSTALVGPDIPSDLVIELPAGTTTKLGLQIGDEVRFKPTVETMARILLDGVTI